MSDNMATSMMRSILIVAFGGSIGAVTRFLFSSRIVQIAPLSQFPLATFTVNMLGCFVAGCLAGILDRWNIASAEIRLLLFTGILGGFTTFSAFGLETLILIRKGNLSTALAYSALSVIIGVGSTAVGFYLSKSSS